MIIFWIAALALGIAAAAAGSRRAVSGAIELAEMVGVSAGFVGVTVVAIGTDLPEIANSISSSISGHGDLNVGDSTGSALTQVTLVLAILLATSRGLSRRDGPDDSSIAVGVGYATVAATAVIIFVIWDEHFDRSDGALLVGLWVVSLVVLKRRHKSPQQRARLPLRRLRRPVLSLVAWLGVVGVAATVIVQSFVRLADRFGVPELVASTVVLALGTSLPELVVDWTAIRRGAAALAVGDLFGSSLVDATLSVGIGPLISPTRVSGEAVPSVAIVAIGTALATLLWQYRGDRRFALAFRLAAVYGTCTVALIVVAAT